MIKSVNDFVSLKLKHFTYGPALEKISCDFKYVYLANSMSFIEEFLFIMR